MIFGKKNKIKCKSCNSELEKKFSFCPYCGFSALDKEQEMRDFGMLGRKDSEQASPPNPFEQMGLTEKMIGSIMNMAIKNLTKQLRESDGANAFSNPEVESFPNGIKIKIGVPNGRMPRAEKRELPKREPTEEQMGKMSKLPRATAKTKIRRLSDRVVYELNTAGVTSPEDIFISKLESGYEIKAIGSKKIYVNSIPVTLPLRGISIEENKTLVEFKIEK